MYLNSFILGKNQYNTSIYKYYIDINKKIKLAKII